GIRVPMLIGRNRDEWALFDVFLGDAATGAMKAHLLNRLGEGVMRVHAAYRDDRAARANAADVRSPDAGAWVDVNGDVVFQLPVVRLAEAHARHAPVWMYRFDWASPALGGRLGAAHALELPFVWDQLDHPFAQLVIGEPGGAQPLGAQMQEAWAAFIRGDA